MGSVDDRLERLEEAQMFLDRRADLLGEQMLDLSRALDRMSRRIDALESRLKGMEETSKSRDGEDEDENSPISDNDVR